MTKADPKTPRSDDRLEVLIHTLNERDGELTSKILEKSGFRPRVVNDVRELSNGLITAGAIVVSGETLSTASLEELNQAVMTQPPWSDVPFIVVTPGDAAATGSAEWLETLAGRLRNVTLLEKPIRLATLITVIRTALASRKKQFELQGLLEDLARSKHEAEQASLAKSAFLANMSHEIRTPLAAMIGFSTLLKDESLPADERTRFAGIIARNGDQLSSLVNDILDLSKVEAGKLDIENTVFSFSTFLAETASLLRPLVEGKGLKFEIKLEDKLPELIRSDQTRIRQILVNLVSNAAKFTAEGSVSLAVSTDPLTTDRTLIHVTVTDTGIGMAKAEIARLFKPFSQADSSVTRKFGGTGLGLALSQTLARALGGDVELKKSEPGVGSEFEMRFIADHAVDFESKRASEPVLKNVLSGLRILLVEDSPDNRLLMTRYLHYAGAYVATAENGRVAVDLATSSRFDLILMDIQMPVLDGLSATREIRQLGYQMPILALTAHALQEERERSLRAGCTDHLSKPIKRDVLIGTIVALKTT